MSVGQRLKQIMKQLSVNQERFSEILDIHSTTLSKILNDERFVSFEICQICHDKFSININWLLYGSGKMKLTGEDIEVCEPKPEYGNNPWQKLADEREARIQDLKTIEELRKEIARLKVFERMVAGEPKQTVKKS